MIKTVSELIAELSKYPSDYIPLRGDNSGGYESVIEIIVEDAIEISTKKPVKAIIIG